MKGKRKRSTVIIEVIILGILLAVILVFLYLVYGAGTLGDRLKSKHMKSKHMKSKHIVSVMLIFVAVGMISSSVLAAEKDKYSEWIGPSKGVSYRYGRNYLGENQWSPYPNYVQFWNANAYRVKITYYETLFGKEYGPYIQFLGPSSDNDPGMKVAIPKDAKVSSITVEPLQ